MARVSKITNSFATNWKGTVESLEGGAKPSGLTEVALASASGNTAKRPCPEWRLPIGPKSK